MHVHQKNFEGGLQDIRYVCVCFKWEKKERVVKVFNEWNKLASKTDNIGTIFHTKYAAAHTNTPNPSCTFTK